MKSIFSFHSQLLFLTASLAIILPTFLIAQPAPHVLWSQAYGGMESDEANAVLQCIDGGYIIAGQSYSFGAQGDCYLVKTDGNGIVQWARTYGGYNNDWAYSVAQTSDRGYIFAGNTSSFGAGQWDAYLVKIDSLGNRQWTRTFGGAEWDWTRCLKQTPDNGFILAGGTRSFGAGGYDCYLVKTDSLGNAQWTRTYGGGDDDEANFILLTSDGGYALTGRTASLGAGGTDMYFVKVDSIGNLQWARTYGGNGDEWALSACQTADGGYAIAGYTQSFGAGQTDAYLVKTNSRGVVQWTRAYGGQDNDYVYSMQHTVDGGYILAGNTWSFGAGQWDVFLVKTDSTGRRIWTRTVGGANWDWARSIQQTSDGGYIMAGGTRSYGNGYTDFYVVRLGTGLLATENLVNNYPQQFALNPPYPNPFNPNTTISFTTPTSAMVEISLCNILGQKIAIISHGMENPGLHAINWNANNYPAGIYFCRMTVGNYNHLEKLILLK